MKQKHIVENKAYEATAGTSKREQEYNHAAQASFWSTNQS